MAHIQMPPAAFTRRGKGFGQQTVERFAGCQPRAKQRGLLVKLLVGERLEFWLQGVDRGDRGM